MKKILFVIGTRPELIKVASIILEMNKRGLENRYLLLNTSQHKDLLNPYWSIFNIKPHASLDVMQKNQNLSNLTARVIMQFQEYIDDNRSEVAAILAQGDTTTVFGTSLVAYYNGIPFCHLEAGLRSFDLYNPYPEEFNRKAASIVSTIHFCPTEVSRQNLLNEGISSESIYVVGNTVIDALQLIRSQLADSETYENPVLNERVRSAQNLIFITCHRRENQGKNLLVIIETIYELASENPDMLFVWTLHPNPNIMKIVENSIAASCPNIILVDPLSYLDLLRILSRAKMAISDSGGIQEEAPSFNVPVLILRKATERPEGITAGAAVLVDADKKLIRDNFYHYLDNQIEIQSNPYGDGLSSIRVVDKLVELLDA